MVTSCEGGPAHPEARMTLNEDSPNSLPTLETTQSEVSKVNSRRGMLPGLQGVHWWCYVEEECYLVDLASSHMLVSKIKPCMFKKLVVGLWVGSAGPPYGVHRFTRPFCRRCAPGLNWLGRASGAVTLKKLECSKQAYALRTTAKAFAKDVFINQERKLGARRRSDTVLVSTINDADQGSADVAYRTPLAPYEKSKFLGSGGSMVARLKLKGIDGRAPPGVEPAA
ncbi:hypothetical protein Tco_0626780 [Tanacetum coccineum]|uniref:Uncharacterized protein n=1 Tax=Tanacetum coccineum TaxID=301880 RepID=A0ABQ4WKR6_9ASTR